ncbi:MAG: hypothetical protein C0582_02765 [Alphaproteobacteria bacterium]|nr:MAG: hypothetical protein C0582_02765 [Alphaproteobacteria bacterium]
MDLILQLAFPFTAHVFVGVLVLAFIIRKKWVRITLIFLTLLLGHQLVKTQQSRKKAISLQQANTIKVTLFQLNLNVENTDLSILINYLKKIPLILWSCRKSTRLRRNNSRKILKIYILQFFQCLRLIHLGQ